MKFLKEPLARLCNREEHVRGAFFEGRYKSIALLDEEALLSVCAYIDLNPLAAGVAVAQAAAELGVDASLKWPNDVVVARGRGDAGEYAKLAGILVEGAAEGERTAAVIGVGLNLAEQAPRDRARGAATSVREETGRQVERDGAAAAVLARLRVWYDAVARGEAGAVVEAFTARALPWWGRTVEVRSGETAISGIARGIDSRGALLLELPDGRTAALVSGEARQVRLR